MSLCLTCKRCANYEDCSEDIKNLCLEGDLGYFTPLQICVNCKNLMFSDCYGECSRENGIILPEDSCEHWESKY